MENEPPNDNKLLKLKFLLTPHLAGSTHEAIKYASLDLKIKF